MVTPNSEPLVELEAEIVELEGEILDRATRHRILAIPKKLSAKLKTIIVTGMSEKPV